MRAFLVALQFLTRIPVHAVEASETDIGRSILFYPLVGLIIGGLLCLPVWLLDGADAGIRAAIILVIWVIVTGGLHLDGLADSADGWLGGFGDRERTLEIMTDSRSGAAAVIFVPLLLIVKFAALAALIRVGYWVPVLLAPVIGRAGIIALMLTTPYARTAGIARPIIEHMPAVESVRVLIVVAASLPVLLYWQGLVLLLIAILAWYGLRALMLARLRGMTGDTAGAQTELVEAAFLMAGALLWGAG